MYYVLLFFFKSKVLNLLSQVKITLNIKIFMFLKDILVVLKPYIILGVFHYFGHHGRPASQIFNPRLSLNYFSPAIIFIDKKNCALGVSRYGLGWKQPRLLILGTLISRLGPKICPNEFIFHAEIEKKKIQAPCFIKKSIWSSISGENWVLRFWPLQWALF